MSDFYPDQYREPSKKSPGQAEIETGSRLVQVFRLLGIQMPKKSDVKAVERTGGLVRRWWVNIMSRSGG